MRLHPLTGSIAHGIAGDGVYVEGRQVAPGNGQSGMPDWWGDLLIYCSETGLTSSQPDGSTPVVIGPKAALVRASSAGWAAWHSQRGVFTSWGLALPKAVLLDMSPDGTILVGDDYQSGKGISAYREGAAAPLWTAPAARPEMRFPYSQAAILDAQTACWTENVNGRMVLVGYFSGSLTIGPRPPWNILHVRMFRVNGQPWVVYLRSEDDRTIAHPWDYRGQGFSMPGFGFGPEARQDGQFLTLIWSVGAGERATDIAGKAFNLAALEDIPSLPAPKPPPRPIGPMSDPLPEGTWIDVWRFFQVDDAFWPRGDKARGDTHGMDMQRIPELERDGDLVFFNAKFAEAGKGRLGELLSVDADKENGCVHWRADLSSETLIDVPSDTRWLRNRMQIGRQYGLDLGDHTLAKVRRDGTVARVDDMNREMWIVSAWERFWCGEDWGECFVIRYCYNNTGLREGRGTGDPRTYVETYYEAIKLIDGVWRCVGWGDWDTNQSSVVFATTKAVFPNPPQNHSDFWHKGGQRFPPDLPTFPMPRSVPAEQPPTIPPVKPPAPMPNTAVLKPGDLLRVDVPLKSQDGRFTFLYQSDGNLVTYSPTGPLWANGKNGTTVGFCAMQGDGNFVQYDKAGRAVWATDTHGNPGAWFILQNDGNKVIYSVNGRALWASGTVYQPPPPVIPPPATGGPAPVLSIQGRQFYDNGKLWIPRMVSGLTLLVRTPAQQAAFLDWAVTTGFNGVRVFAGALTWAGQTPTGALAALPSLLDQATTRGLAVEVTAITDSASGYDVRQHMRGALSVCAGRPNVLLEWANEIGHPSQASFLTADWLRAEAAALPLALPWALGAASVDEPIDDVYPAAGGAFCTAHLDRGRPSWNNVRRVREIYAITEAHRCPAINNEPMGADEFDGSQTGRQRWNDPALFYTLGVLERAFAVGGVHHSQAGLYAQLPGPVQQACATAYVTAHRQVESVLPGLVGQYKNVGHDGSPLVGATFVEGGSADGVVRAYSFISGSTGVTVLVGAKGNLGLQWGNGWRQVREVGRMTATDGRDAVVLAISQ